jgi:hypothetical protein
MIDGFTLATFLLYRTAVLVYSVVYQCLQLSRIERISFILRPLFGGEGSRRMMQRRQRRNLAFRAALRVTFAAPQGGGSKGAALELE